MFDWANNTFKADYSLGNFTDVGVSTIRPELPVWDIGETYNPIVTSQTSMPTPKETGGFFDNVLRGVTSTAETFLNGAVKIYELDNAISSRRLQQKQIESGLKVNELKTVGGLELQAAQLSASKEIGLLQAQTAVKNEQARIRSSEGASIVSIPAAIPTPLILIGGAIALYFATRGK